MKKIINDLTKLLPKEELVVKTTVEMPKTILMDSETLLRHFSDTYMLLRPLKYHNLFAFYPGNLTMPLII